MLDDGDPKVAGRSVHLRRPFVKCYQIGGRGHAGDPADQLSAAGRIFQVFTVEGDGDFNNCQCFGFFGILTGAGDDVGPIAVQELLARD